MPALEMNVNVEIRPEPTNNNGSEVMKELTKKVSQISLGDGSSDLPDGRRVSADDMDERRRRDEAYEYLCHLEEIRVWIGRVIGDEKLPEAVELEENLRNGVYLARLVRVFEPNLVPDKSIYDRNQSRFKSRGLNFKHTDNANHFITALKRCGGFPAELIPETLDVYEKKNMPKVIFCLHAFAMHLFKKGAAPMIQDLVGKVSWPENSIISIAGEFTEYGLEMPTFSKIGGVLAADLRVDEAAHHAAIIAVNESLDGVKPGEVVDAFRRSAAALEDVDARLGEHYHLVLVQAKAEKVAGILNRSFKMNMTLDAYDEYLTAAEIQGFIHCVNQEEALLNLRLAVKKEDRASISKILIANKLAMKNLCRDNVSVYVDGIISDKNLDRDKIQTSVNEINRKVTSENDVRDSLTQINEAIRRQDESALKKCVNHPSLKLPPLQELATPFLKEQLLKIMIDNGNADLTLPELTTELRSVHSVFSINDAVVEGDKNRLESLLENPSFESDESGYLTRHYLEVMFKLKSAKEALTPDEPFLTRDDIQDCLDDVRESTKREEEALKFASIVNAAVESKNDRSIISAFQSIGGIASIGGDAVKKEDAPLYLSMLDNAECRKGAGVDALRIEDIQYIVGKTKRLSIVANETAALVRDVDASLENGDVSFASCLGREVHSRLLQNASPEYYPDYFKAMKMSKELKSRSGDSPWVCNVFKENNIRQYVNVETSRSSWELPMDFNPSTSAILSNEEIQTTINLINSAKSRLQLLSSFEPTIEKFQALCKGVVYRRMRAASLRDRADATLRIQKWWRASARRRRQARLKFLRRNVRSVVIIQRWWRKLSLKSSFQHWKPFYEQRIQHIVTIQAWFRGCKVRRDYHCLKEEPNLNIRVLRKFIHLLDNNGGDFQEEIEMQRIQHEVIQLIKSNNQLEKGLDEMDVKIGLLIRNRISLQDVINQNKKISRARNADFRGVQKNGLKDLNAESRRKLEAYQNLFYLLQTNPSYLAKLIFEMPQNRSTKFMESVILTLYNYGSNSREEYLLMKLFETALNREVAQVNSVGKMVDVLNGNPLVVKMIISYARRASSSQEDGGMRKISSLSNPIQPEVVLKEVLQQVVTDTLRDPDLKIETNPVDIYKRWINVVESETGKSLNLPYNVSMEKALEHQAVTDKLERSIASLTKYVEKFLDVIAGCHEKLPYVIRFAGAILKKQLEERFPEAPSKAILKVVGNLLYYRYINPAIVAPDSFNIVDMPANKCLTTDQRRNLGSIAKILQLIASKKGFGKESPHLQPLNDFIMESHERMKKFFVDVCRVDDPETHFNMTRFHDACLLTKPSILIPAQEVVDAHQLFLEYEEAISPDHTDPLHDVLEELGEVATLEDLVGKSKIELDGEEAKKTEILLTLSSKETFVDESKKSSAQSLYIRTKHMIADLIRSQPGNSLQAILQTPASSKEECLHRKTVTRKMRHFRSSTNILDNAAMLSPNAAILKERTAPLDRIKPKVILNLRQLERIGLTSSHEGHKALLKEISDDIKNHHQHRRVRRRELNRLKTTKGVLKAKTHFLHEQADYYDQYIESCLANLNGSRRKNWRHASGFLRSGFAASIRGSRRSQPQPAKENGFAVPASKPKGPFRFTGRELYEKGILISIQGVSTEDLKDVLFELKSTELTGVFEVLAKYMGVVLESLEISIQYLLQLQYENVSVVHMCERVEINVNLLIFLLNKKFFGR